MSEDVRTPVQKFLLILTQWNHLSWAAQNAVIRVVNEQSEGKEACHKVKSQRELGDLTSWLHETTEDLEMLGLNNEDVLSFLSSLADQAQEVWAFRDDFNPA